MIIEEKMQGIDMELSLKLEEELVARADSMGLSVGEFIECIIWQHVESDLVPA